jgi:aldehyde dehydrogenase (NAD+)
VARTLGVATAGMTPREAALAAADAVEAFLDKIGHPARLRDVGVPEQNLQTCAFHALTDLSNLFNARPVGGPEEILALYQQAY